VAEENGSGVVGVAPGCALMPIRTSGWIDDSHIEALFDWIVDNGADVVSCSWSATDHYYPLSLRQRNVIHRAATLGRNGHGCVIVFAAANNNRPLNGTVDEHDWPGNWPNGPTRWLNGFATHEDVISVAASTSLGKKAAYSNWGAEISVCAPSNNASPSTYPNVTTWLPGLGVVTTDRGGYSGYSPRDYTYTFGGTSSACPVVAGVAALVLSANPYLNAQEVREILQSTADKIEDTDPDPQLGQSFGTYDADGHSQWFGYGKVNALAAVTEALARGDAEPQEWIRKVSAPMLHIPDNRQAGVSDSLHFAEPGNVLSLRLRVDLTHTYIGDLRLTLTAPNGTSAVLHERNGGRTDDIHRSFDLSTSPALSNLLGSSIAGAWTLRIQDLAPADTGTLNEWELELQGRVETVIEREENPGVTIPDNDPNGIERTLTVNTTGQVREVEVSVDITHTFIRDLVVSLVSPTGTSVELHRRSGGSADNIITTYTSGTTAGLQALRGESIQGSWRLKVADFEGLDVGKLNRWGLRISVT
jgi:subtilisin-like proprotein convertase family protein